MQTLGRARCARALGWTTPPAQALLENLLLCQGLLGRLLGLRLHSSFASSSRRPGSRLHGPGVTGLAHGSSNTSEEAPWPACRETLRELFLWFEPKMGCLSFHPGGDPTKYSWGSGLALPSLPATPRRLPHGALTEVR